jgi:hypothetical protein
MNQNFLNYNAVLERITLNPVDRSKIVATALGLAVSALSTLPVTEVDSPAGHFTLQVLPEINNIVSEFNENTVIDCKLVVESARAFWMMRYTAAHPVSRPVYSINCTFFESLGGVGLYFSPEQVALYNLYKEQILTLATVMSETINLVRGKNVG